MKKTVAEVIELLENNGWNYKRTKGDHHIFTKPGMKRPIVVAGKRNQDLAVGTLLSILRPAGLKK